VHDSQEFPALGNKEKAAEAEFADSAYKSAATDQKLKELGIKKIHSRKRCEKSTIK